MVSIILLWIWKGRRLPCYLYSRHPTPKNVAGAGPCCSLSGSDLLSLFFHSHIPLVSFHLCSSCKSRQQLQTSPCVRSSCMPVMLSLPSACGLEYRRPCAMWFLLSILPERSTHASRLVLFPALFCMSHCECQDSTSLQLDTPPEEDYSVTKRKKPVQHRFLQSKKLRVLRNWRWRI